MAKLKRLINGFIPVSACNFRWQYCYLSHGPDKRVGRMPHFKYSAEYMGKCFSMERMGGACLFNLCGDGETLLPKEIPSLMLELLKQGHYIELVTNGTITERFREIVGFPEELRRRIEFKFSFHYLQLKQHDLMEVFFDNIATVRKAGCSVTVELVPHDELEPYIPEIKQLCMERLHTLCQLTIPRDETSAGNDILTKHSKQEFYDIWRSFDSPMFEFKYKMFNVRRREFCYAGLWSLFVNMETGDAWQCYATYPKQNIYAEPEKPITLIPVGHHCRLPHCHNAHALLSLGDIPELRCPETYADIRDRQCLDGTSFLTPEMRETLRSKFYDNSPELSEAEKRAAENFYRRNLPKRFCHDLVTLGGRAWRKLRRTVIPQK